MTPVLRDSGQVPARNAELGFKARPVGLQQLSLSSLQGYFRSMGSPGQLGASWVQSAQGGPHLERPEPPTGPGVG